MTNLDWLKKMTASEDEDLLLMLLEDSESEILTYTRRTSLVPGLETYVRQYALIKFNRRGMEGETSRSEAGISSSMEPIPTNIVEGIRNFRLARVNGYAFEGKS